MSATQPLLPDNGPSAGSFRRGRGREGVVGKGLSPMPPSTNCRALQTGPWAAQRAKWKRSDLYFRMSNPTEAPDDVNAQVPPRKPEQALRCR